MAQVLLKLEIDCGNYISIEDLELEDQLKYINFLMSQVAGKDTMSVDKIVRMLGTHRNAEKLLKILGKEDLEV